MHSTIESVDQTSDSCGNKSSETVNSLMAERSGVAGQLW